MPFSSRSALALRLGLAVLAMSLLAGAYSRIHTVPTMSAAAKDFLNSLWPEQREKALFKMEEDERFNWFYTPVPRKGLPLREMSAGQRQLALALLSAGLSQQGFIKTTTIMSADEVLAALEGGSGPRRDADGYFVSIFGQPTETGTWGYRIDGHHVSQNFTIVNGKVIGAPSFFGVNPALVEKGPRKGLRVLAREEDLGREFLQALSGEQRKTAIVDAKAPGDILTEHSRQAALTGQASGIQASALNAAQRQKLTNLLDEYAENMAEELADLRKDQIRKAGSNLWFAWAGGIEKGEPHYYRIQTAAFLIEYDNTQNNANHIHSVWRDFAGDFGRDLLKEHYQANH
jgi:Protein of unknown function (DUF3500)